MLAEIKATFRSLKSGLGLHLVYHQKEERVTGHLFITLPTKHKVIHLRTTTKAKVRQKQIYNALNITPDLIGKCKTMIDRKKSVVPTEIN